jgi:DNA-binding response OmpR family regulator
MSQTHILLVEDDLWLSQLYADTLLAEGYLVTPALDADSALETLDSKDGFDLIILDMFLPGHNGIEFLHEVASYSDTNILPVIVLSSVTSQDLSMDAERWRHYGVRDYLYKPETKPKQLIAAVKKQLLLLETTKSSV